MPFFCPRRPPKTFTAPVKDMLFAMEHLAQLDQIAQMPGFEEANLETAQAVLEECARLNEEVIAPLNWEGDKNPSWFEDGQVRTTPGFAEAFRQYAEGGWQGLQHPAEFGGQGLPKTIGAACGEILYEIAVELGQLTPAVALPLYVAVSTDTGCFVYSNVTANTHRVAAALMETGIDYRAANKRHFRTKTKKRLALEAELLRTMEFYDEGRVVVVTLPLSLAERLSLTEADMDDVSALGGVVEGTDCSITMKETKDGAWKISVRTGARVNATKACAALGGGGHRAASGCVYHGSLADAKAEILAAVQAAAEE